MEDGARQSLEPLRTNCEQHRAGKDDALIKVCAQSLPIPTIPIWSRLHLLTWLPVSTPPPCLTPSSDPLLSWCAPLPWKIICIWAWLQQSTRSPGLLRHPCLSTELHGGICDRLSDFSSWNSTASQASKGTTPHLNSPSLLQNRFLYYNALPTLTANELST